MARQLRVTFPTALMPRDISTELFLTWAFLSEFLVGSFKAL